MNDSLRWEEKDCKKVTLAKKVEGDSTGQETRSHTSKRRGKTGREKRHVGRGKCARKGTGSEEKVSQKRKVSG